ncbi:MAG: right-handed parallel beta-helix repeat-containing protein [Planctomycetes bacterium]|nr:right-handed parallel beta-helix repeat-containing protein [Planctomycetota bacterium]
MRTTDRFMRVACIVFALCASARASTYYVSPSGSDAAAGTSAAVAWKTLQKAANVVQAGDTVIVLPGTYAGFNLFTSGAPGAPITFTANSGGSTPNPNVIVNTNNTFTGKDRINLEGASHVVIEGFTVLGTGDPATNRTGIRTVLASHVTIRANRADLCGRWGILTGFVDDVLIEDNECSRSAAEHGIYVSNSGDRPIVRRNRIWGNHSNGLHMNGDVTLGGDGVISDALVERNVIWENGNGNPAFGAPGGSAINCDGVQNATIRNNLLYLNHKSGISLYRIDGGAPSSGNRVVNNTVRNASDARWALNIQDASSGNVVVNNVLLNDHSFRGAVDIGSSCLPGMIANHNAVKDAFSIDGSVMTLAQWKATTGLDSASFVSSVGALFASPATGDYQLKAGAPAIDKGQSTFAPNDDLLGKHRPAGLGFDIGSYEFGACFGSTDTVGSGISGTAGVAPLLSAMGCPDQGSSLTLQVAQAAPLAAGMLFVGTQATSLAAFGGTLYLVPALGIPHVASAAGTFAIGSTLPMNPALTGSSLRVQAFYADGAATQGVSATAGLEFVFD